MSTKYVYTFGDGKAEGKADMKNLLGGKGANLAEMNLIGVPVPAGFTITTEVCTLYNKDGRGSFGVYQLFRVSVRRPCVAFHHFLNSSFKNSCFSFIFL